LSLAAAAAADEDDDDVMLIRQVSVHHSWKRNSCSTYAAYCIIHT